MRMHAHIAVPLRPWRTAALTAILAAGGAGCSSAASHATGGSPSPTAHPSASGSPAFAAFAGKWIGHGSYLVVRSDGRFTISKRTYRFCSQNPPPCDTVSGNTITNGDVATGQLTSLARKVATGEVTRTTDPADSPAGRITMTLNPASDTISARSVSFCGPRAPVGKCGA